MLVVSGDAWQEMDTGHMDGSREGKTIAVAVHVGGRSRKVWLPQVG
jgi:hypothetical protein